MNRDLGRPIALGRTAEIYPWENGHILKLFFDWFDPADIEFEQHMNRAVHASGLPVPAPGEMLQVNGRNGLVYERVDGVPMWEALGKQPWRVFAFARRTAELHAEMHSNTTRPDIPPQRRRLEYKIRGANPLSDADKEILLASLSALPDGDRICHGDFHPNNILLTPGEAVVIDWIDSSLGNPLADAARTTIILLGAASSSQIQKPVEKFIVRLFHSIYLRRYFRLRPGGEKEYHRWLPVVAAARLCEGMTELEGWLLNMAGVRTSAESGKQ